MGGVDDKSERVLVLYDGSPACVACCAIAPESRTVVLWAPPGSGAVAVRAMEHQARLMDLGPTCDADAGADPGGFSGALGETRLLLAAMERAVGLGCGRVVWPVVCGPDLDAMTSAAEIAELVTRLGWIAFPNASVRVETPLSDLTPAQVADLLEDLRAPGELLSAASGG